MLTPVEIQNKTFKSGGLGYDKKEVEAYMHDISRNYEELYRQNMELKDKVSVLNEGIQYYKTIEKTLQKALILAEKTSDSKIASAEKEAKRIEKEARTKANIIVADAKNELDRLHSQTVRLIEQYERYRLQFKNLARTQMELVDSEAFNINIQNLDAFLSANDISAEDGEDSVSEAPAKQESNEIVKPAEEKNDINLEAAEVTEEVGVTEDADEDEFLSDYSEEDFEDIDDFSAKNSEDNIDNL